MDRKAKSTDSTLLCFKYLLFILNFFYFVAACTSLGVAVWIYLEKDYMSDIYGSQLMTVAAVFVIVCGGIAVFLSFFGCCGSITENRTIILVYFVCMLILFIALVTAGVLALVFRAEIGEHLRNEMRNVLSNDYGVHLENSYNRAVTEAWDDAQTELHCCGVDENGWAVYKQSQWYAIQPGVEEADKVYVPISCCKRDLYDEYIDPQKCQTFFSGPPGRPSGGLPNEAVHYKGCYYRGKDFIWEMSGVLIGLGIGVGLSIILGLVCAVILYIKLSRN